MRKKYWIKMSAVFLLAVVVGISGGCGRGETAEETSVSEDTGMTKTDVETEESTETSETEEAVNQETVTQEIKKTEQETKKKETGRQETEISKSETGSTAITWDPDWKYAENSKIHSGSAILYYAPADESNGKTVCVNAGHGTSGGTDVYTLCHPDGTPKVTGGSTAKGQTKAAAVSSGTTMSDGTSEAAVTLKLAKILKDCLLEKGYNVLMIREDSDVQLDNIARTVMANQYADCHIALHYDSSENDKGAFYIGVPDVDSYRSMEPVASHWQEHERLGKTLLEGMKQQGVKIFGDGSMDIDLTQTSYSTIPSVDVEVGDRGSDYSEKTLKKLAEGIAAGLDAYF